MNKKFLFLSFLLTFLISCASSPKEEEKKVAKNSSNKTPIKTMGIKLPITTNWQEWHCQDNYSFSAKFSDSSQNTLEIRRVGGVEKLTKQNSNYPAIYEGMNLAFFSNGKSAVLGVPKTDEIIASGCLRR